MRQSHETLRLWRSKTLAGLALGAVILLGSGLTLSRDLQRDLWGDEGTYVAMTASLVHDGDLVFGEADLERLVAHPDDSAPTVILQDTSRGVTYSKPLLYPLISAPFYALLGEKGLLILNYLALAVALVLTYQHWRTLSDSTHALWMLGAVLIGSATLAYGGWMMSDLLLLALALTGLLLALGGRRTAGAQARLVLPFGAASSAAIGGILLGAAVSMRFTSAALAAAVVVALVLDQRVRRAALVAGLSAVGFLGVSGASLLLQGTANPYKAVRSSFNQETGYPAGDTREQAAERFVTVPATQSASWVPRLDPRRTTYSTLYFLIGRHTGLLAYFPVALVLLTTILRRPDRISLTLLGGVLAIVGFYLLWMPENYFGGSTFIGNRYFLGALPALMVAPIRLPSRRALAVSATFAMVAWGSAIVSARSVGEIESTSQIHARAGLFRLLPFESTARRIDGVSERYWAEDYVRFVDPFAVDARWSFRLDAENPAAEVLVATDWQAQPLHFVVSPDTAEVRVAVRDWRGVWEWAVPAARPEPPGLIAVDTSPPWRRHAYWWKPGRNYDSRVLRFSLTSDSQVNATAVVRYAGKGRELAPLAAGLPDIAPPLPARATVGSEIDLCLQIRNTGRRPWKRGGLFPVSLGYRWIAGARGKVVAGGTTPLKQNVAPGRILEVPLSLESPTTPGIYQLAIDLQRAPVGALGHLGRLILETREVQVEPATSPDSPAP